MPFIIQLLLFIFFSYLCFYIPGKTLLWLSKVKFSNNLTFCISWIFGVATFILISYLSAWAGYPKLPFLYIGICTAIFLFKRLYKININFITLDRKSPAIILLGSLLFLSLDFFSGTYSSRGLGFFGTNSVDGFILLSYIQNMINHFPPTRPGLVGYEMRGYHYFYPFLLSRFSLFFGFDPIDLLFRHFALLTSLLYGVSFYIFAELINTTRRQRYWILILAYLGRSFIPFLSNSVLLYTGVVDPLGLIHNPSWLLAITFLLVGWAILLEKDFNINKAILGGILLGMVAQTKVYAGIIALFGIAVLCVFKIIKTGKIRSTIPLIIAGMIAAVLTAITYFPSNWGQGKLVWAQGLYYEHFMAQDKFDSWHWYIKKTIFLEHGNLPRLLLLYGQAVALFWALSIGSRVLLLLGIKKLRERDFYKNQVNILLLVSILCAIIIPSFFIQSQGVFDIGQFLWLAVALMSIPTGVVIGNYLDKHNPAIVKLIIILIAISPGVLGYLQDLTNNGLKKPEVVISYSQLQILREVNQTVSPHEFVVFQPGLNTKGAIDWPHAPYISALTGRSVYYEKSSTPYDTGGTEKERLENLTKLYSYIDVCSMEQVKDLFRQLHTKYLIRENKFDCQNINDYIDKKIEKNGLYLYELRTQ